MHQKIMDYTRNGIANFVEITVSEDDHTIWRVKLIGGQVAILFDGSNGFSGNINKAKSVVTLFSLLLALLIVGVISNTLSIFFVGQLFKKHINNKIQYNHKITRKLLPFFDG